MYVKLCAIQQGMATAREMPVTRHLSNRLAVRIVLQRVDYEPVAHRSPRPFELRIDAGKIGEVGGVGSESLCLQREHLGLAAAALPYEGCYAHADEIEELWKGDGVSSIRTRRKIKKKRRTARQLNDIKNRSCSV